jgi:hypothetical protein
MASKYPKTSNQGTAGTRKHVTLTIPQKLEKIRRHERRKQVTMASYNIRSLCYIETE